MSIRTIKDPTFNIYAKGGNVENKNRPIGKEQLMQLAKDEADILFDLELEPNLPLKHVLNKSLAKMKVGPEQADWNYRDYDVKIGRISQNSTIEVWKEQIERTFKFISEANIQ